MDKYYTALLDRTHNMEDVVKAGWIDKTEHVPEDLDMYTTALQTIVESGLKEVSVLYYPGCFAPVHEGHLQAMRLAKQTVEATGETVVAGYFAPDHDDYILRKTNDNRFIAPNRVRILKKALENEQPWMQVDVWPSLYAPTDLNFTTLYDRFKNYVQKWVPEVKVKVYLIFGGDNYLFANSFTQEGNAVVIPREGVTMDTTQIHPDACKNVLVSETSSTNHSSTAARATYMTETPELLDCYLVDDVTETQVKQSPYARNIISSALNILVGGHLPVVSASQLKRVTADDVVEETTPHEEIFFSSLLLNGTNGVQMTTPNGTNTSIPLLLPYVDISEHTPVHADRAYSLSIELWRTNMNLFKNSDMTVAELKPYRDFESFGFDPHMTVEAMCAAHLKFLTGN